MKACSNIVGTEIISNRIIEVKSPITKKIIGTYSYFEQNLQDYNNKLDQAFTLWASIALEERLKYFENLVAELKKSADNDDLSELIHFEIGKPIVEAKTEVEESISLIDYYLQNSLKYLQKQSVPKDEYWVTKSNYLLYEPIGILGIIKPWNYPLTNSLWSLIPSLIAGNTVLYKPSEFSSLTGGKLFKLFEKAGFPDGVINLLLGGEEVGEQICKNDKIKMISFTGSTEVSQKIISQSNNIIRKYSFETGGSDFAIIVDHTSSSLDNIIDGITWGAFNNSGQVCTSIEHILIQDEHFDIISKKIVQKANELKENKDYGPIQNQKLESKVNDILSTLKKDLNCKLLCGGDVTKGYLSPTIFSCSNSFTIETEFFSNIVCLHRYNVLPEALKKANTNPFGLGCSIWTKSPFDDQISLLVRALNVGMVWVNDVNISFPELPWTGRKKSGIGFNLSPYSLQDYSQIKSLSIDSEFNLKKEWWFPYE